MIKSEVRVLWAAHPDMLNTACDLAATPAGQGSVDDIQGGSITSAPEKHGISVCERERMRERDSMI
jgi:hypothetical protein